MAFRIALTAQAFRKLPDVLDVICKSKNIATLIKNSTKRAHANNNQRILNTFEMRYLWYMLGVSLSDQLRKDEISRKLSALKSISNVIKVKRLKWFGHTSYVVIDMALLTHHTDLTSQRSTCLKEQRRDRKSELEI